MQILSANYCKAPLDVIERTVECTVWIELNGHWDLGPHPRGPELASEKLSRKVSDPQCGRDCRSPRDVRPLRSIRQ